MNMKKNGFCAVILTLVVLLLGMSAAGAKATWTLENNVLTISGTGYFDGPGDLNKDEVKKIVVQDGITGIGLSCFEGFSNVTEVVLPDGVLGIYEFAFYGCSSLTTINIPDGVVEICNSAFNGCSNLTAITIPSSVEFINPNAFYHSIIMTVERGSYAQEFAEKNGLTYVIRGEEKEKKTGATTVEEKIKEIIANEITDDMNDYQKALALHNWLIRNCDYDYTYSRFYGYDALMEGSAVCNGFTEAYSMLLKAVGIDSGFAYGTDHVWNVVKIDGEWCHVDVTWDNDCFYHPFFAVTDAALKNIRSHENKNPIVVCNNYKLSQAYRSGELEAISRKWIAQIEYHYRNGEFSFETDPAGCKYIGDQINIRMAAEMLQAEGTKIDGKDVSLKITIIDQPDDKYILKVRIFDGPLGDITGDKIIDGRDAIRLMKYLADEVDEETGKQIAIDTDTADLNNDGVVNELDLLQLMKQLAQK